MKVDDKWAEGDNKTAFLIFRKLALAGESSVYNNLGFCPDEGMGTSKNFKKTIYWYKLALRIERDVGACTNISSI
ncbi:MAG: hypothetical protein LBQ00_08950 [Syntrophobacterales bacterium]|nr:hypothetical protein [Syntrophobacterales bacterium]